MPEPSKLVQPGDVLVVRQPGFFARAIRLGARLRGLPDLDNHVAILHHKDPQGTWWVVEGRPGGVGWADATDYLDSPYTIANWRQPKTKEQRNQVTDIVEAMLHTPYDWPAIAADALNDLHLPELWGEDWGGNRAPGHVVCSSLAAWGYYKAGLANPATDKLDPSADLARVQPADWEAWITARHYQ